MLSDFKLFHVFISYVIPHIDVKKVPISPSKYFFGGAIIILLLDILHYSGCHGPVPLPSLFSACCIINA